MDDGLHIGVCRVESLVIKVQVVLIVLADTLLVEDTQHLVQPVVDLTVKTRYLHNDTVVIETVYELVGDAASHWLVLIVEGLMAHIHHRLFYLTHRMSQQIDGYHRQGVPVGAAGDDVLRILVVYAQVLTETQGLGGEPGLLQLYQDKLLFTIGFKDSGTKVDAEN